MTKGTTRARGIRSPLPKGHIWGRSSTGQGDAHPIKVGTGLEIRDGQLNNTQSGGNAAAETTGIGFNTTGLLNSGEELGRAVFAHAVTFPSAKNLDDVFADVASSGTAVCKWMVAGVQVGTITFTSSANGVTAWGGGYTLPANTPITLLAPNPADATLFNVTGTVYGDAA